MLKPFFKNIFCFLLFASCFLHISFAQITPQQQQTARNVKRFVYQTSLSMAYGVGKNYVADDDTKLPNTNFSFEAQQLIAYQFNRYFYTGGGAGADIWLTEKKISAFIPMFLNATVKFVDWKVAPYAYVNVGYAFKWQVEKKVEDDIFYGNRAGLYVQTGLGFNIAFSDNLSLLLSPYYKLQLSAVQYRENELLLVETKMQPFHFVGIKIGLLY